MRTFSQSLPADADRRIRNFRRALRYRYSLDRPKRFFAADGMTTSQYVTQWCRINSLRLDKNSRKELTY